MAQFNLGRVRGDKGDKGDRGKSFRLRGAWASGVEYINDDNAIDVVNYSGSAYACKTTHTSSGASPSTEQWELLLSNEFDIVHTDTISDTTKVPSSAVTYALGQEIDAINNNLAWQAPITLTLQNGWSGNIYAIRNGLNQVFLYTDALTAGTLTNGTVVAELPTGYKPRAATIPIVIYQSNGQYKGLNAFRSTGLTIYNTDIPSGSGSLRFGIMYLAE